MNLSPDARAVLEERLLASREIVGNCWLWTKSCQPKGYGQTSIPGDGRNRRVHRVAAALWLNFDLDSTLLVIHSCDTPRCFNPAHLRPATNAENTADMVAKGRARNGAHLRRNRRLTEEQAREARVRRAKGETYRALGEEYGVTPQAIFNLCNGRSWVGFK